MAYPGFGTIKNSLFVRISSLCGLGVNAGFLFFSSPEVTQLPLSFLLFFGVTSYIVSILLCDLFKMEGAGVVILLLGMDLMCLSGFLEEHFQFFTIVLIPLIPSFTFLLLGFRKGVRWFYAFFGALFVLGVVPHVPYLGWQEAMGGMGQASELGFVIPVLLGTMNIAGFSLLFQRYLEDSRRIIQEQFAEITRLSMTDPLTRIYNRRAFLQLLESEFARSERIHWRIEGHRKNDSLVGPPEENLGHLSVLLFDIDHFKLINDRYGHPTGDRVLCAVAEVFNNRAFLRETDCAARYGGEEFIVYEPDTHANGAWLSAERIRKHIAQMPLLDDSGETFTITISCGITERRASDSSLGEVISRADKALYESKNQGRNRSTIDGGVEPQN